MGLSLLLGACGSQNSALNSPTAPLLSSQATNVCATTDLAANHPALSSGDEFSGTPASAAFDNNPTTRWSSPFTVPGADSQWVQVDLGSVQSLCQVTLQWEAAYGKSFEIQSSLDGASWTPIYTTTTGPGGNQTIDVSGSGRYVRMQGVKCATGYGYSLSSMLVYGTAGTGTGPGTGTTICGTENVALNKPATASSTENVATTPDLAVDGNAATRWSPTT